MDDDNALRVDRSRQAYIRNDNSELKPLAIFFSCILIGCRVYLVQSDMHLPCSCARRFSHNQFQHDSMASVQHLLYQHFSLISRFISLFTLLHPFSIPRVCAAGYGVYVSNKNLDQVEWSVWIKLGINVRLSYSNYDCNSYEPFAGIT